MFAGFYSLHQFSSAPRPTFKQKCVQLAIVLSVGVALMVTGVI